MATGSARPPLIRPAVPADLEALRDLRNHYILTSTATFDEEPLDDQAVAQWLRGFSLAGPRRLLVAMAGGRLLGYASTQPYRPHPAFRRTVETSIYVAPDAGRSGIGSALYQALFAALAGERLHRALAGIALPNPASVALHRKFGFTDVGVFDQYAEKAGEFISSLWMQRRL